MNGKPWGPGSATRAVARASEPEKTYSTGNRLPYRFVKRAFDVVLSAGTTVVLLVPGLVLSAFVARDTGGTPLYTQRRVTKGGKEFTILKFRTMVADADDVEKYLDAEQLAQWQRERKVDDDPRITPLGRFLRKTSIDEFPQFLNVLAGQLSIVGPRAITADELEWYTKSERVQLLSVRAGIAWDIIAPKPEAGKRVSGARILPAYEGSRTVRAVAA